MDLWSKVANFAELIGILLFILIQTIKLLLGRSLDDLIFNKVISIVTTALVLREVAHIVFCIMIGFIGIGLYFAHRSIPRESDLKYPIIGLRIINGWLLGNWIIFEQINSVFLRNAIVTYPFLLGSTVLILVIIDFSWNSQMQEELTTNIDLKTILGISRYVIVGGIALILIIPTILPMSGLQPTPPEDPPQYGGQFGPYSVERTRLQHEIPTNISDYLIPDNKNNSWYIFIYTPQISQPKQVPVTIFAHGYTGTNPADYENSLYQLASRGNAVIFVQYVTDVVLKDDFTEPEDTNFTRSNAMYIRYLMEFSGILQAIDTLTTSDLLGQATLNPNYLQIIGHSVGGGMVPYLATKVTEQGWGKHQLILDLETPWYASEHPKTQYNLSTLPANTIVNVVGSQDDHLASPCIGMIHFERFFNHLPTTNLAYLIIPSDYHGFPRLVATHYVVTTTIDDTLTRWGYLKRVDAMVAFLGASANNNQINNVEDYFLGDNNRMTSLGSWSDGTSVEPLTYSQDPFGIRGSKNLAHQYISAHESGPEICTVE